MLTSRVLVHSLASKSQRILTGKNFLRHASLVGRDFLTLKDFNPNEVKQFLWTAADLKQIYKYDEQIMKPLDGKSIALIFQKRSTRTRVSTEAGMALLGGYPVFLSPQDIHLGVSETLEDSARVLSGFCDLVFARVYSHSDLVTLANYSSSPVINGLSDTYHPLQVLADFQTLQEFFGRLKGLNLAFIGDCNNNMTHSFMMGGPKMGMNIRVASPKGYEPAKHVVNDCLELCGRHKTHLLITNDPFEAIYRADVVVTDTIVSMGREEEKAARLRDFQGFQVNREMCNEMKAKWCFLHCLPRKPEEVTDDIFYDKQHSLVWQASENRKWTVMAVMLHLLKEYSPSIIRPLY